MPVKRAVVVVVVLTVGMHRESLPHATATTAATTHAACEMKGRSPHPEGEKIDVPVDARARVKLPPGDARSSIPQAFYGTARLNPGGGQPEPSAIKPSSGGPSSSAFLYLVGSPVAQINVAVRRDLVAVAYIGFETNQVWFPREGGRGTYGA